MNQEAKNFIFGILAALFFLNIIAWLIIFDLSKPRLLQVTFFDVGQGSAVFIQTPQRQQILIDGGPDDAVLEKLGEAMPFWDRSIDLVILTHPESDHLSGLIQVLKRYHINQVVWTGVVRDISEYVAWQEELQKEKADVKIARTGQRVDCSVREYPVCYLEILFPFDNLTGQKFQNSNDTSMVAKLVFGSTTFLFTGDIHSRTEERLIESGSNLDVDILNVAHHGSKTSSSEEFIDAVSPQAAVISAGRDNPYGHPHQEVLENLSGARILRTDLSGDIKIFSDGNNYKITSASD